MEPRKQAICDALARWIKQRPGLEYGNYGNPTSYRAECRSIARDKREAETLLAAVRWRDGITADDLIKAAQGAYSGRLSIVARPCSPDRYLFAIEYCTGQYWPTEYRRAVCAVLASALWEYTREKAMPVSDDAQRFKNNEPTQHQYLWRNAYRGEWLSPGDWLRRHFRKEFGRGIASRWFR